MRMGTRLQDRNLRLEVAQLERCARALDCKTIGPQRGRSPLRWQRRDRAGTVHVAKAALADQALRSKAVRRTLQLSECQNDCDARRRGG